MKKSLKNKLVGAFAGLALLGSVGLTSKVVGADSLECTTIQQGILETSEGNIIETGFDQWGYNYQGHMFNGKYYDSYRDAVGYKPYKDYELQMKWNNAWLSNKDCDGDGKLDKHYGFDSYIGSGAWLTNHQSGGYENDEGKICYWNYFAKIIAVSYDAKAVEGVWYAADGIIGPVIWENFAIIQEIGKIGRAHV